LEIANKLLADRKYQDEAGWRTAVGRAYYAAFLRTKKKLEELGSSFPDTEKIHQEVIQKLMERHTDLGNKLDTLRDKRVDADYRMSAGISDGLAKNCARVSQLVISSVETMGS
jgi:uncharacterized protein (UPF0332 family)